MLGVWSLLYTFLPISVAAVVHTSLHINSSSSCMFDLVNLSWSLSEADFQLVQGKGPDRPLAWVHLVPSEDMTANILNRIAIYERTPPKMVAPKSIPVIECLFPSPNCAVTVTSVQVFGGEFADGHTFVLSFDQDTASPNASTKEKVDTMLGFSANLGKNYTGTWKDAKTLVITVWDTTGCSDLSLLRVGTLTLYMKMQPLPPVVEPKNALYLANAAGSLELRLPFTGTFRFIILLPLGSGQCKTDSKAGVPMDDPVMFLSPLCPIAGRCTL